MRNERIAQIGHAMGVVCEAHLQVSGYQIDSRLVRPGDLFFALKGERVDGHQFLADAKQKGAIGAVVERGYTGEDFGLVLLKVDDVLTSLQTLARMDLEASGARVIGVTGSVGKTTTKDFLAELLKAKFRVGKTARSYNTKCTLPLSILNREGGEEVFVLEMGMSEPGDLKRLLQIAEPEIAILTKVALAHAANFPGGLEEIAREKAEIFLSPKLRVGIYPQELIQFPDALKRLEPAKRVSFSLEEKTADYFLFANDGTAFIDERGVRGCSPPLPFQERHFLYDFLAALSAARQMKLEWGEIRERIPYLEVPKMRFERFEKGGVTYINDAYNANPASMRAALESLPEPAIGGKRIGVLGVMSPLGIFSAKAHREVGLFARGLIDHLLVFGEEAEPLFESFLEGKKPAELFVDLQTLSKRLQELTRPGDVVLVKGSRIMEMEKLFESCFC